MGEAFVALQELPAIEKQPTFSFTGRKSDVSMIKVRVQLGLGKELAWVCCSGYLSYS